MRSFGHICQRFTTHRAERAGRPGNLLLTTKSPVGNYRLVLTQNFFSGGDEAFTQCRAVLNRSVPQCFQ